MSLSVCLFKWVVSINVKSGVREKNGVTFKLYPVNMKKKGQLQEVTMIVICPL